MTQMNLYTNKNGLMDIENALMVAKQGGFGRDAVGGSG